jgi:hypothetical protein
MHDDAIARLMLPACMLATMLPGTVQLVQPVPASDR